MKSLADKFSTPQNEFRPIPWWAWTGELDYREMEWQLKEMLDKGIREFFIFPIYGLEIPYLSEEWWKRISFTLKKCKELGMRVWIYDEYNWPSGTSAFVLEKHPEARSKVLQFREIPVRARKTIRCPVMGGFLSAVFLGTDGFVRNIAVRGRKLSYKTERDGRLIVTTAIQFNQITLASVGSPWCRQQKGYIDVTSGKAVDWLMEGTHLAYERRCRRYFGNVLKGFFTDEPSIRSSTWPAGFIAAFKKEYGYDLRTRVHELNVQTGSYLVTRYHYWSLITRLFSENYMRKISDWCERRRLLHTGHLLGEERLEKNVLYSGDIFQVLKTMQVPGLDLLDRKISYDNKLPYPGFGDTNPSLFIVAAKLASGSARFGKGRRVMCEAFGVRDWGANMEEQKRITDWLAAMGVDLINDNSLIYSIEDFRKRAISGKHFTSPWWQYYGLFSDYCARVCMFVNKTKLDASIGVLYPTANAWAVQEINGHKNLSSSRELRKMDNVLAVVSDTLVRNHWDFEILSEEVIRSARVRKGKMITPNGQFRIIILPGARILDKEAACRLKKFADGGGKIITVDRYPKLAIDREGVSALQQQPEMEVISLKNVKTGLSPEIYQIIKRIFDIKTQGDIISAVRSDGKETFLFLSNLGGKTADVEIAWNMSGYASLWDAETGEKYSLSPQKTVGGLMTQMSLAACQSVFLVITRGKAKKLRLGETGGKKHLVTLKNNWEFVTQPANLFTPRLQVKADKEGTVIMKNWFLPGKKLTGWVPVNEEETILEISPEKMQLFWIRAEFTLKDIPSDLAVVVDSDRYEMVWLNGKRIEEMEPCLLWDRKNLRFRLKTHVRIGKNILVIGARPTKYFSKSMWAGLIRPNFVDPVVLSGNFQVADGKRGILIQRETMIKTGSWTGQGYPNFAGTGIYSQDVTLKSIPGKAYLEIEKAKDIVEVRVNGKLAGIRPWPPYEVEISGLLKTGRNHIEIRVTNSFANILRRRYHGYKGQMREAGILGTVRIITSD